MMSVFLSLLLQVLLPLHYAVERLIVWIDDRSMDPLATRLKMSDLQQELGWRHGWEGAIPLDLGSDYQTSYLMARSARLMAEQLHPSL